MALEGNIETFYLSSLFQLLSNDKKTGKLRITNDVDVVTVSFSEGTIICAASTENEQHLGNLLRSEGIIGDMELANYLSIAKSRNQRLGQVLVDECYISREELTSFIRLQAENILFGIFMWTKGKFRFEDCPVAFSEENDSQFDTMELILEASRRADELSELRKQIPPKEQVLRYTQRASRSDAAKGLSVQETAILRLVNGTRTIREIIQLSSYDEFTASKAVHTVLEAGLVELKEQTDLSLTGEQKRAPAPEQEYHPPEPDTAQYFEQMLQKSSQIQSMYEKNLKSAPRKSRGGLAFLLLLLAGSAALYLYYWIEKPDFFDLREPAPAVQAPAERQQDTGQDREQAWIPETQSLQDKNSFFFLSLPSGFTAEDRSSKKKTQILLTYASGITVEIEARYWAWKWNPEDEMYTAIAELQTERPGMAPPAVDFYSLLSLGGGQGYEILSSENINAILCKSRRYKIRAHQKMVSITVSCRQCTQDKNGALFGSICALIKKSLLIYP